MSATLAPPASAQARLVELLVDSEAWDREAAERVAPRLVAILRSFCACGGRGTKRCRLRLNDPRHGKRNGYVNGHCSCDDCTYANTRYVADLRVRRAS